MDDNPFGDPSPFGDPTPKAAAASGPPTRRAIEDNEAKLRGIMDKILALVPPDASGLIGGKGLRPVLTRADIPLPALKQAWTMVDTGNRGALNRDELRSLLCLIALIQQGRPVNLDQLRSSGEVPVPKFPGLDGTPEVAVAPGGAGAAPAYAAPAYTPPVGSPSYPAPTIASPPPVAYQPTPVPSAPPSAAYVPSAQVAAGRTALLGPSTLLAFQQMSDREAIDIKVSERVGNGKFFGGKTVYYDVSSKYFRASVTRRYSDFAWLQENLLKRYPARLIPQLPPKNFQIATPGKPLSLNLNIAAVNLNVMPGLMDGEDHFVEARRRGLARFLEIISRHPVLSEDEDVRQFYSDADEDALAAYRKARPTAGIAEEFTYNPVAASARELIPASTEDVLKEVSDRLANTTTYCNRMAEVIEQVANRFTANADGFNQFSASLQQFLEAEYPRAWLTSTRADQSIASKLEALGLTQNEMGKRTSDGILETLRHMENLAISFQRDYQNTMRRIQTNRSKLAGMGAKGAKGVDQLTSQIEQDERLSELLLKRDDFVTYCILQELSFFNHYKGFVSAAIKDFVRHGMAVSEKTTDGWRQLDPYVQQLPLAGF